MNKFITLAALGLCFSSINAQEAKEEKKAEEGFVSLNLNCYVKVKANSTFLKCSSFITLWKIVP